MDRYLRHISLDDDAAIDAEFVSIVDEIVSCPEIYYETPAHLIWDARISRKARARALKSWRRLEEKKLRHDGSARRFERIEAINQALTTLRTEGV